MRTNKSERPKTRRLNQESIEQQTVLKRRQTPQHASSKKGLAWEDKYEQEHAKRKLLSAKYKNLKAQVKTILEALGVQ